MFINCFFFSTFSQRIYPPPPAVITFSVNTRCIHSVLRIIITILNTKKKKNERKQNMKKLSRLSSSLLAAQCLKLSFCIPNQSRRLWSYVVLFGNSTMSHSHRPPRLRGRRAFAIYRYDYIITLTLLLLLLSNSILSLPRLEFSNQKENLAKISERRVTVAR